MTPDLLCAAVQEAPSYLAHFNRREYTDAFRSYAERFAPVYMEAVRDTAGDAQAMTDLADGILDALEAGWKARRPWNRSAVRVNEKQMVVVFLSPLLLGLDEPLCQRLAELLRDRWAARWPKDAYRMASFSKIQKGFRTSILGLELPSRSQEDEDV